MSTHIEEIIRKYMDCDRISVSRIGGGHINDTYEVWAGDGRYICQRISPQMDVARLVHNYTLYSDVLSRAGWKYPEWMRNRDGEYITTDDAGDHWRVYPYIEGEIHISRSSISATNEESADAACEQLSEDLLYAAGRGLATMHRLLADLPGEPMAVYPTLHDLRHYYERYIEAVESTDASDPRAHNDDLSASVRDPEIEAMIASRIDSMLALNFDRSAVVHGDAKLSNMLFDEGQVIGFIDMDTVMRGSLLEDIADCIRSCCMSGEAYDTAAARSLIDGYVSVAGPEATSMILDGLDDALRKICFELGLRYYTDAISPVKQLREDYPGSSLAKARSLLYMDVM